MQPASRNRDMNLETHSIQDTNDMSSGSILAYQPGDSITEQTISQYSQGDGMTRIDQP